MLVAISLRCLLLAFVSFSFAVSVMYFRKHQRTGAFSCRLAANIYLFAHTVWVRLVACASPLGTLRYQNQHCCAVEGGWGASVLLAAPGFFLFRASARPFIRGLTDFCLSFLVDRQAY